MIVFIQFLRKFLYIETDFLDLIVFKDLQLESHLLIPLRKILDALILLKNELGKGGFGTVFQTNFELASGKK